MRLESQPGAPSSRGHGAALVAALRPAQWTKNAVVLAPLVFSLRATDGPSVARALGTAAAFCGLASAAYLANDVADREVDRRHPVKRRRPIAAGELPVRAAVAAAAVLAAAGLAAAGLLGLPVLACAAGYLALQVFYSRALKHLPILDVFAIAGGFVLRAVAGAEAIAVPISGWLYLCTLLLALFLALEKRRAELVLLEDAAAGHRASLGAYTPALLDQLVTVVAACTVLSYALYTLAPETVAKFGSDRLKYTLPFVLFGIFRYLYLVARLGRGGEPEWVLLRDPQIRIDVLCWLAVVAWALYLR